VVLWHYVMFRGRWLVAMRRNILLSFLQCKNYEGPWILAIFLLRLLPYEFRVSNGEDTRFCLLGYNTFTWSRWLIGIYHTERCHHNLEDCSTNFQIELKLVNVYVWDFRIKITYFKETCRAISYNRWETSMATLFQLDALLRLSRERSTEFRIVVNKNAYHYDRPNSRIRGVQIRLPLWAWICIRNLFGAFQKKSCKQALITSLSLPLWVHITA
jgi:hypothetical protein